MSSKIIITYDDNLQLEVKPDTAHEWLLETALVAKGYDITEKAVYQYAQRNASELIEGKHYLILQNEESGQRRNVKYYTKKGVIRLGFFIKSERAKRFRDWAEDLIVGTATPSVPTSLKDALLMAYNQQVEIEQQKEVIKELAPKAEYTDKVLSSVTEWTTTTIAKELGLSAQKLNSELYRRGIHYQNSDGVWVLYAKYDGKGLVETRTYVYQNVKNEFQTKIYTVWTEKGRNFIHMLLNNKISTMKDSTDTLTFM